MFVQLRFAKTAEHASRNFSVGIDCLFWLVVVSQQEVESSLEKEGQGAGGLSEDGEERDTGGGVEE